MATRINKKPEERITAADSIDNAAATSKQTTKKVTNRKPSDNFLRVDLKPEGYDLKAYINKRCGELSVERDMKVSSTAYIQELIIKDMGEKKTKPTQKDRIKLMIDKLSDKELSALETLLNAMR